nr:hypothetical protein [Tanacetum cinerariifolium]
MNLHYTFQQLKPMAVYKAVFWRLQQCSERESGCSLNDSYFRFPWSSRTQPSSDHVPQWMVRIIRNGMTQWFVRDWSGEHLLAIKIETVLRAYGHWNANTEDEVDEKKNYTTKGIIFQTLPENVLLQVAKHKNAKDVWESIKIRYIGAERVQKARLQILRNELEMLKMNDNKSINDFAEVLPIVAPIEQYSDLETMPFEEAVERVKTYEERLQSLEAKDEEQRKLLLASEQKHGENSERGRGRGRNFDRGGRGRGRGRGRGDKSGIRCYDCGEFGHFSYECTK